MKLTFLVLLFSAFTYATCPQVELGESEEDCPWAEVARELEKLQSNPKKMDELFIERLPDLRRSIRRDAKAGNLLSLWGKSLNYDENAKADIVLPPWLDRLLDFAGVEPRQDRIVHAGIEHTYGYLFSNLKTPFGYKRARWVRGVIEEDLGLTKGLLGPAPSSGTLFSNVTYLLAKIALPDLAPPPSTVADEIARWDLRSYDRVRVVETVSDGDRRVEISTDLVAGKKGYLLVYSIKDSEAAGPRLITAFPVDAAFFDRVTSPQAQGADQPIRAQYNAYLENFSGREWRGARRLEGHGRTTGDRPSTRR